MENNMSQIEQSGIDKFSEKYLCKITVLKCDFNQELYEQYPYGYAGKCGRLKEGQVFITKSRWDSPEHFCTWAWRDLLPGIHSYHEGKEYPSIACCTDGLRPVTFKLEKLEVSALEQ